MHTVRIIFKNAVEAISSETGGRIDVLVNNAGYGLNGPFEDLSMDEIKAQYETNFFGLIRATQAVSRNKACCQVLSVMLK